MLSNTRLALYCCSMPYPCLTGAHNVGTALLMLCGLLLYTYQGAAHRSHLHGVGYPTVQLVAVLLAHRAEVTVKPCKHKAQAQAQIAHLPTMNRTLRSRTQLNTRDNAAASAQLPSNYLERNHCEAVWHTFRCQLQLVHLDIRWQDTIEVHHQAVWLYAVGTARYIQVRHSACGMRASISAAGTCVIQCNQR